MTDYCTVGHITFQKSFQILVPQYSDFCYFIFYLIFKCGLNRQEMKKLMLDKN